MKVMIFFEGEEYVRNYITTDAFSGLGGHKLSYVLADQVSIPKKIEGSGAPFYRLASDSFGKHAYQFANRLQMYDRSKINKNFLFRLRRELIPFTISIFVVPNPFSLDPNSLLRIRVGEIYSDMERLGNAIIYFLGMLKSIKHIFLEMPGLVLYFFIVALVKLRLKPLIINLLLNRVPLNEHIKYILGCEQPDLLIIPNSIVGHSSYEFIRASKKIGSPKILVLVDNWDNLSSKSAFIINPDYLGVWGKQSVDFAKCFHEIPCGRIRIIGTPRFGVYSKYKKNISNCAHIESPPSIDKPYILFAGCAVGFDETGALRSVARALQVARDKFPVGTVIVYRPHPWGGRLRYLNSLKLNPIEDVIIDPQIQTNEDVHGTKFQPSLEYYPQLLDKALLVICPLSTMVIEATIMGKQVLALVHEDSFSLLSPNRVFANYKHFNGLEELENISIVASLDNLPSMMVGAYQSRDKVPLSDGLEFFVSVEKDETYATRLSNFVKDIEGELSEGARSPSMELV